MLLLSTLVPSSTSLVCSSSPLLLVSSTFQASAAALHRASLGLLMLTAAFLFFQCFHFRSFFSTNWALQVSLEPTAHHLASQPFQVAAVCLLLSVLDFTCGFPC